MAYEHIKRLEELLKRIGRLRGVISSSDIRVLEYIVEHTEPIIRANYDKDLTELQLKILEESIEKKGG